eukprot:TRINITY_DN2321_c0_g1_i1.p1 TRINITY_DN2321_c0_g1~~TRINITY_DN2321_c0_g1_i1.p1  ORF type:complete len:121 (+),score=58.84 TRINITY_DN2321_c0_g1_i1:693-1055(+)
MFKSKFQKGNYKSQPESSQEKEDQEDDGWTTVGKSAKKDTPSKRGRGQSSRGGSRGGRGAGGRGGRGSEEPSSPQKPKPSENFSKASPKPKETPKQKESTATQNRFGFLLSDDQGSEESD